MGAGSREVGTRAPRRIGPLLLLALVVALTGTRATAGAGTGMRGIEVSLSADKSEYAPHEPITLTLRAINPTTAPVTLEFSSAQRFDVSVRDGSGHEVWRWGTGRMFAQALGRETIAPRDALVYLATIDDGLPSGTYEVTGVITAAGDGLTATVAVRVEGP